MRIFRYWNRYVTLGGLVISLIVCGMGILLVSILSFPTSNQITGLQMTIIPARTYTPTPNQEAEEGSTEISNSTNGIQIGGYVQITGTDGEGLRIRSDPGLNSTVNFYGMDNEVFIVQDGPQEADGYTWWFIASPYDSARSGWSASNYLTIVEQ